MLCGGLGNQLFQYAFARSLSLRSGTRLTLDTRTLFKRDRRYRRQFELGAFRLSEEISLSRFPTTLQYLRLWLLRRRNKRSQYDLSKMRYIEEVTPGVFDPSYCNLKIKQSVLLKGYWHCPLYFSGVEDQIRSDLIFRKPVAIKDHKLVEAIQSTNSVGIHVRRLDFHRRLSIDYYREAMSQMKKQIKNPRFFVFSDDCEWWRDQAGHLEGVEIVSNSDTGGLDDFQLLSMCKHFIIANSSYSWWAAWLGKPDTKHVIAPSKAIWIDSWDVLPEDWEVINVDEIRRENSSCPADLIEYGLLAN